ncbi:hypothetical protein EVJ58_g6764, partial [Rhodofomes roseus]
MVFGQHGRLVVPALLNARFIDVKQQHTVEGLFNRIMGEVETVGMATNWLYFAHQDFENRLGRLTMQTMQNHRDMYRSMEAIAPMTERLLEEFKRLQYATLAFAFILPALTANCDYSARVGLLENRLARLYNHAIVGGMPTPSRPTDKGMGHGHDDTADATATSTSSYTASSSTSTSASTTSLPLSTSSPTSSSSSTPTAFASSSVSDEKKQEIRRLGGTSSGKDYAGESRLPMADAEVRTDFLVEMLHGRHSRKGVPLRTSSRDEGEEEKAEPEELRDDERQSAAAILQATHQNHRNAWVRTCENERIDQNLESLEYEEARFSRIWDGQRTKAVRNLRTASGLMSILTPRLAQGEALAREMEANVVPAGHEGVVPLLQIKFEKPIDEMSEAEMREVLKSLPATIALDSRLLRGLRERDDRYGRDDEDEGEYDEDEDDEDIGDEDKEGEGPEEEEAPPPRADKGKAREVPASSIPLHGGIHHAPSRAVR